MGSLIEQRRYMCVCGARACRNCCTTSSSSDHAASTYANCRQLSCEYPKKRALFGIQLLEVSASNPWGWTKGAPAVGIISVS